MNADLTFGFLIYWIIVATLCFVVLVSLPKVNNWLNGCLVDCDTQVCNTILDINARGDNYSMADASTHTRNLQTSGADSLNDSSKKLSNKLSDTCLLTKWHLSHVAVHFIAGFLFPSYFVPALLGGIMFEFYETRFDCHDSGDLLMNTAGFLGGSYVNRLVSL